jgi:hypothetical protein
MAEKYHIECDCGKRARVELYEAGTDKRCEACQRTVRVPDTITLQQSSGDNYPLLRPLEKILVTLNAGEPPFDGLCHHCETREAGFVIPARLRILVERQMKNDGGFRPTINGSVKLVASAAKEHWKEVWFPLFLCDDCEREYFADQNRARRKRRWEIVGLISLFIAFMVFAFFFTAIIALLYFFFWLMGAIAWAAQFRDRKKIQAWQLAWLEEIRWVPEALAMEDEYHLETGPPVDLQRVRQMIENSEIEVDDPSPVHWWQNHDKRSYFELP